jgi:CRISPR/Cas system-associated protein Cas5 (RAMP superfamily)
VARRRFRVVLTIQQKLGVPSDVFARRQTIRRNPSLPLQPPSTCIGLVERGRVAAIIVTVQKLADALDRSVSALLREAE